MSCPVKVDGFYDRLSYYKMHVRNLSSQSIGPIGLWLDMQGSNPCPIVPYAIVLHVGFEPLTQDSMSNPLTNCTILGHDIPQSIRYSVRGSH